MIPLVVHHGASGWNAATSLMQLYDLPPDQDAPGLREVLARHLLDVELLLDDISQKSDGELRRRAMGATVTLTLILMTRIMAGELSPRHLAPYTDLFVQVMNARSGLAAVSLLLHY